MVIKRKLLIALVILVVLMMLFLSPWGLRPSIMRSMHSRKCQREVIAPLEALTHERHERGFKGRYCLSLAPSQPTNFLIISNVHGEKDSFERLVNEWKAKGWLLGDLKLKEHTYLVLNGNIIGIAPNALQMFPLIIALMKANPERLYYIRGAHEDKEHWRNLSLGAEIKELDPESDTLRNKFRAFFATLPLCLYIFPIGKHELPLRISYFGAEYEDMTRSGCYRVEHQGDVKAFCSLDHRCSFAQPKLGALIVGEEKGIDWQRMLGLQFVALPPAWHVVSTPHSVLRALQRYFVDSYVVLSLKEPGKGDTLTLYHNSKEKPDLFIHDGVFILNK